MTLDRQGQFVGRQSRAVVGDRDANEAAAFRLDLDPGRAGVDRVLDQFLQRAGRPLHHLAGGDAVYEVRRQAADGHAATIGPIPPRDGELRAGRITGPTFCFFRSPP